MPSQTRILLPATHCFDFSLELRDLSPGAKTTELKRRRSLRLASARSYGAGVPIWGRSGFPDSDRTQVGVRTGSYANVFPSTRISVPSLTLSDFSPTPLILDNIAFALRPGGLAPAILANSTSASGSSHSSTQGRSVPGLGMQNVARDRRDKKSGEKLPPGDLATLATSLKSAAIAGQRPAIPRGDRETTCFGASGRGQRAVATSG
jgi:hypothetical protein